MADELIDIVNEDGDVLRQAMKSEAHKQGWMHKTVIATVRRDENWVMIEQSSDRQDAGQLVNPVGGHVGAGESDELALVREAEEEIGLTPTDFVKVGQARFHRSVLGRDENHLFVVFEIRSRETFTPGPEVSGVEEFTPQQLKDAIKNQPERFGDAMKFVMKEFFPDYVA